MARIPFVQRVFDPVDGSAQAARWRFEYVPSAPDVIIAGDSRNGIDLSPTVIEQTLIEKTNREPFVVNLAVHGHSMEGSYLFLKNIVFQSAKSPVILLNVSEVALNDFSWEDDNPPEYMRALADPPFSKSWARPEGQWAIFESISGIARLRRRVILTVEDKWPSYLRGEQSYDWGGSRWNNQMDPNLWTKTIERYRKNYLKEFTPQRTQGQYLKMLLKKAKESNQRLVLIISPVTNDYLKALPSSADIDIFLNFVCESANQQEVPLFNYYQVVDFGKELFFDPHHLNWNGTQKFSKLIANEILQSALENWDAFEKQQISKTRVTNCEKRSKIKG